MNKKFLSVITTLIFVASILFPTAGVFAAGTPPVTEAPPSTYGITYEAHVQNIGWQTPAVTVTGDQIDISQVPYAGTVGDSLRMEALKLTGTNLPAGASITYEAHVQNIGWQTPAVTVTGNQNVATVSEAGTHGQSLRMEAIKITLNGLPGYEVKYEAHGQYYGWTQGPVTSVDNQDISTAPVAGTTGESLRMEALRIEIVKTDAEKAAEVAAINAVTAYEDAPITTLTEVTAAEALGVTANEKVALVAAVAENKTLTDSVTAQKVLVDAAKAELNKLVVSSVSAITATNTLGVVEVTVAGTTAADLQAAITPASTVVAKAGDVYTVTITGAAYDTNYTLAVGTGFELGTGVSGAVSWVAYATLTAQVETKVVAYETLANGSLSTQALIDAAITAYEEIDLAGINVADTAAFNVRIAAADAKITAAQTAIDDKNAVLARTVQFVNDDVIKINNVVYTFADTTEMDTITDGTTVMTFGGAAVNTAVDAGNLVDLVADASRVVTSVTIDKTNNNKVVLTNAITAAQNLIVAERAKAVGVSANDVTALGGTVAADYVAATKVGGIYDLAITAAEAANVPTASTTELATATTNLATATTNFATPKGTFDTAVKDLTDTRAALTKAVAVGKDLLSKEQAAVTGVSADDQTALGADFTNFKALVANDGTYGTALQDAEAANVPTASTTDLATATTNLATATTNFATPKGTFDTAVKALADARKALTVAITAAQKLSVDETAVVAGVSTNDRVALGSDFTGLQSALITNDTAVATAVNANTTTASTSALTNATSALTGTIALTTAKGTFNTAVTGLASARKALTDAIPVAQMLYDAQKTRVDGFSAAEIALVNGSGFNFNIYYTGLATFKTDIATATSKNTATANKASLIDAKTALSSATSTITGLKSDFDTIVTGLGINK